MTVVLACDEMLQFGKKPFLILTPVCRNCTYNVWHNKGKVYFNQPFLWTIMQKSKCLGRRFRASLPNFSICLLPKCVAPLFQISAQTKLPPWPVFFSPLITKKEIFKSKHSRSQASTGVCAKSHNLTLNFMARPLWGWGSQSHSIPSAGQVPLKWKPVHQESLKEGMELKTRKQEQSSNAENVRQRGTRLHVFLECAALKRDSLLGVWGGSSTAALLSYLPSYQWQPLPTQQATAAQWHHPASFLATQHPLPSSLAITSTARTLHLCF